MEMAPKEPIVAGPVISLVPVYDPVLREPANEWIFNGNEPDFAALMFEFMLVQRGIGLAAPQIGVGERLFVMGTDGDRYHVFNPRIVEGEGEETYEEGCLTFPSLYLNLKRYKKISVVFQNENADTVEREFDGIMARCFQHELDHLNGILFVDHASKLKLDMAIKKREKILRRAKNVTT